jgi:hypothetical protein
MMMKMRILALATPLVFMGPLHAQPALRPSAAQRLEGSWSFTIVTDAPPGVPAPTNYALANFSSDGLVTVVANPATFPIPPVQNLGNQISGGLGEWVRIGDKQFRFTQVQLIFKNGVPGGFQRTRVTLTLNDTLDSATGTSIAEFLDLNGTSVFSGTAVVAGNRMGVDASPAPSGSN